MPRNAFSTAALTSVQQFHLPANFPDFEKCVLASKYKTAKDSKVLMDVYRRVLDAMNGDEAPLLWSHLHWWRDSAVRSLCHTVEIFDGIPSAVSLKPSSPPLLDRSESPSTCLLFGFGVLPTAVPRQAAESFQDQVCAADLFLIYVCSEHVY